MANARVLEDQIHVEGKHFVFAAGGSDDTRPNAFEENPLELVTGSAFLDVDNVVVHFYNETTGKWDDEAGEA